MMTMMMTMMMGWFMHVCLCITYMAVALRGQARISDPLEVELQTVVNCHVRAGL